MGGAGKGSREVKPAAEGVAPVHEVRLIRPTATGLINDFTPEPGQRSLILSRQTCTFPSASFTMAREPVIGLGQQLQGAEGLPPVPPVVITPPRAEPVAVMSVYSRYRTTGWKARRWSDVYLESFQTLPASQFPSDSFLFSEDAGVAPGGARALGDS